MYRTHMIRYKQIRTRSFVLYIRFVYSMPWIGLCRIHWKLFSEITLSTSHMEGIWKAVTDADLVMRIEQQQNMSIKMVKIIAITNYISRIVVNIIDLTNH